MRFKGFIGGSYTLQSVNVDCQRTVNLYPEMDESGQGEAGEVSSLVGAPGLKPLCALPTGPVRDVYADSKGHLWAVAGNTLYSISNLWAYTAVGTLNTTTGPVKFSDNGLEMVIVDGPYGYGYTFSSGAFSQITDPNFLGANQVDFLDSYFIFNKPNTNQVYNGPSNALLPFDGTNIATVEAQPENLVGLCELQENLYLFGGHHTEIWYDNAGPGFPFERIQGAVIEFGCAAAFSIAKLQNTVFWLGQDKTGQGIVYMAAGLQPQKISTQAIETVLSQADDLSGARAYTYQQNGHAFYCLNVPGLSSTWCFDVATSLWHERVYLSGAQYQRSLPDCHAFAYNTNVVGDYSSGNLYSLDPTVYTDNGNSIPRERTSPHVGEDLNYVFYSAFQLDMETGVGTDGTNQGNNPQVMLQWSDDWGHTWSNEHWTSAGKIGQRKTRVKWRRLGRARDRVWRVKITDPVKVTLLGAELDLEEGSA